MLCLLTGIYLLEIPLEELSSNFKVSVYFACVLLYFDGLCLKLRTFWEGIVPVKFWKNT